jgi:hypothetical protein
MLHFSHSLFVLHLSCLFSHIAPLALFLSCCSSRVAPLALQLPCSSSHVIIPTLLLARYPS